MPQRAPMTNPLAFTVVLDQFTNLRVQANDEWHAMKAAVVGPSLIMTTQELMKSGALAQKALLSNALRKFVKALPDQQLYALLAMMYAGRDGKSDPVAYWDSSIRRTVQSRSAAVEVMLEKEPAAQYIRHAIDSLAAGLELDEIPSLVAAP